MAKLLNNDFISYRYKDDNRILKNFQVHPSYTAKLCMLIKQEKDWWQIANNHYKK